MDTVTKAVISAATVPVWRELKGIKSYVEREREHAAEPPLCTGHIAMKSLISKDQIQLF